MDFRLFNLMQQLDGVIAAEAGIHAALTEYECAIPAQSRLLVVKMG